MKRERLRLSFSIFMAIILILTGIGPVFGAEFKDIKLDEKEIEREWEKADKIPVESDKIFLEDSTSIQLNGFGQYPKRKGVILVTSDKYKGIIPTGHAAIVYTSDSVVESLSGGVTIGKNNWNRTRKTCYGVTVRATSAAQDSRAANWCYGQRGKPYNWDYTNVRTRKKFYCSQLIYAAFLDLYGINLNTSAFGAAIHPMELVNTSRTSKIYEK